MLRLLADENFNNRIVRGILRRTEVDITRAQDVGLIGADDPTVLKWAAENGRVVLTHDVSTMTKFAYERVAAGEPMPGVFEAPCSMAIGDAIENILILVECSHEDEWEGQVRYLPL